jgi:hypothetical protein
MSENLTTQGRIHFKQTMKISKQAIKVIKKTQ